MASISSAPAQTAQSNHSQSNHSFSKIADEFDRETVINIINDFHKMGFTYDEIACLLEISRTTIWRLRHQHSTSSAKSTPSTSSQGDIMEGTFQPLIEDDWRLAGGYTNVDGVWV